jgi:uncharacterized protein (TIGR02271 family)
MSQNPVNSKTADTTTSSSSSSSSSAAAADAVVNWDRIIHKNVRTLDNQGMGKVIAVPNDEATIIISSQSGSEQYKIPRSAVSGFNGAEVLLNETAYKIMSSTSYRVDNAGVYEAKHSDIVSKENQQQQETGESATTTIPLIEERLNVSKKTSTAQYTITKEPAIEKKTIEVPVTHEELVVERRPPKDSSPSAQGPVKSKTEIKVHLNREDVEVTKEPFVKEEVVVKKNPVTETRIVSDTVRSDRVNISDDAEVQPTSLTKM